ncbi:MAG: hypothetical protein J6Q53_01265 [Oscillospiraceae bacterium]|nr:hypothetical protein [Oscillospiraceae bacterium]
MLGTPADTVSYIYGDSEWGDLLTACDRQSFTYDGIGNLLSDGTWSYAWKHGRELAAMTDGSTTWRYTYIADGMRTKRTTGSSTYTYAYNGGELDYCRQNILNAQGERVRLMLRFTHSPEGTPLIIGYTGNTFYYVTNAQGDVVALLDRDGSCVVQYAYDAWGKVLSITGPMADTLGVYNPLL